jgi:hypothetical protein
MNDIEKGHPQCCHNGCKKYIEKDDGKTVYGSSYCGHFIPAKRMNREELDHQWYRGCCAYIPKTKED